MLERNLMISKKHRKATRIEKGLLLAVVWLAKDMDQPSVAADLAKAYGVNNLDVSDHAEFDQEVFAQLNEYSGINLMLSNVAVHRPQVAASARLPAVRCDGWFAISCSRIHGCHLLKRPAIRVMAVAAKPIIRITTLTLSFSMRPGIKGLNLHSHTTTPIARAHMAPVIAPCKWNVPKRIGRAIKATIIRSLRTERISFFIISFGERVPHPGLRRAALGCRLLLN